MQARGGLSRAEEQDNYYLRAWLASVPRHSMKNVADRQCENRLAAFGIRTQAPFQSRSRGRTTKGPFRPQHGTSDLWSWITFPLDNLKKNSKKSHHEPHRPASRPRPRREREGEPLQQGHCADYDPYIHANNTRPHEADAPTETACQRACQVPSQASGSLGLAPCSTYSSSMAAPRETHGLRPRRSEAHIDTQCRDPLPGVALCGLAALLHFPGPAQSRKRIFATRARQCPRCCRRDKYAGAGKHRTAPGASPDKRKDE